MSRFSVFCAAAFVVVAAALPVQPARAAGGSVKNAEDLLIVDCLLPGQIRSLGRQATFMSARRPIRTTQADCQIRGGEYVSYDRANYQTALKVWMDQAMAGSAEAQNNVGEIYSKGLGTDPDYAMAALWFKKAADQGYNRAKINLGFLYEQGLGVPQDQAMALNLYREGSGIQDELLYASEVEVEFKKKDEQISGLQGQVQAAQADSAELRAQVAQLKAQLAERRRALETTQRELDATQQTLAKAQASQDTGLSKLLQNELLAQEQKINSQRTEIA
jgi:TPR repeat protein